MDTSEAGDILDQLGRALETLPDSRTCPSGAECQAVKDARLALVTAMARIAYYIN